MKHFYFFILFVFNFFFVHAQNPEPITHSVISEEGLQLTIEMDAFPSSDDQFIFKVKELIITGFYPTGGYRSSYRLDDLGKYGVVFPVNCSNCYFKLKGEVFYQGYRPFSNSYVTVNSNNPVTVELPQAVKEATTGAKWRKEAYVSTPSLRAFDFEGRQIRQIFEAVEKHRIEKENEKQKEDLLSRADRTNNKEEKINLLKEAKRYTESQTEKEEIDQKIANLQKEIKEEKQEKQKEDLLSRADRSTDKEETVNLLKEAKQYTSSRAEEEEIDRKISNFQKEIKEEEQRAQASETGKSAGGKDDNGEEESYTSGNDTGDTQRKSSGRSKAEIAEEKQKQRDAARKRDEERQKNYMARKQAQNEQNRQLAYSSAAASASMFYLLGGVIYSQYGKTNPNKLYSGSNLFTNLDLGFSLSTHPLYFASEKEDYNYDITKKTVAKNTITVDLNLSFMLGYDTDNIGGYAFGKGTAGMSPIFDSFMLNYDYGGRLYGGLKNLKVFGEYQTGNRDISTSDILDSQEYGSGKSNHSFTNVKAGIKISWYKSGIAPARHHIYLGLIEEKINSIEAGRIQRIPNETEPYVFTNEATYTGYMFEWRHDQHGVFFVNVFPKYPLTGITGGSSSGLSDNDGNLYFQIGFLRSFGAFH